LTPSANARQVTERQSSLAETKGHHQCEPRSAEDHSAPAGSAHKAAHQSPAPALVKVVQSNLERQVAV
jgi:hypothetical protein